MVETSVPVPVSSCARALKAARPSSQSDRDSMLARTRTHTVETRKSRRRDVVRRGGRRGQSRSKSTTPYDTGSAVSRLRLWTAGRRVGIECRPPSPGPRRSRSRANKLLLALNGGACMTSPRRRRVGLCRAPTTTAATQAPHRDRCG